jgi:hypothetical protein
MFKLYMKLAPPRPGAVGLRTPNTTAYIDINAYGNVSRKPSHNPLQGDRWQQDHHRLVPPV